MESLLDSLGQNTLATVASVWAIIIGMLFLLVSLKIKHVLIQYALSQKAHYVTHYINIIDNFIAGLVLLIILPVAQLLAVAILLVKHNNPSPTYEVPSPTPFPLPL